MPVLGAPDHMVCRLIDTIPVSYNINHVSNSIPHGTLCVHAIPPVTEVTDFLARIL
jgi:hypothetical protein